MWGFCRVGLPRVAAGALFSRVTDECRCRGLPDVTKHGRDSDIGTLRWHSCDQIRVTPAYHHTCRAFSGGVHAPTWTADRAAYPYARRR